MNDLLVVARTGSVPLTKSLMAYECCYQQTESQNSGGYLLVEMEWI